MSAASKSKSTPAHPPAVKPSPKAKRAEILSSRVAFKGKVFSVTRDKIVEPGGVAATRDVVRHNGSVVIFAVDSSRDAADPDILIERQYRHAAGRFMLELPAGSIDPGEKPLAAAKRELIEETGFRARKWSRLVRYFPTPGFVAESMQIFLAEDLRPGEAKPEADEKITLLHVPLSELLAQIQAGEILDGKTILGALFFAKFRLLNHGSTL